MITHSYIPHSPAVFGPEALYQPLGRQVERCLISFSHQVIAHALKHYDCETLCVVDSLNGPQPIYGLHHRGQEIAFYMSPISAAGAGTAFEVRRHMLGATKLLCFGSCGALSKELHEGQLILPTRAYRDEGLSYHYQQAAPWIEVKGHARLRELMQALGLSPVEGPVWTTDGLFRETRELVARRQAEGCIAVDMECSGLQALCDHWGIDYYTFFYTGDLLDAPEWDARILGDEREQVHQLDCFELALELLSRV